MVYSWISQKGKQNISNAFFLRWTQNDKNAIFFINHKNKNINTDFILNVLSFSDDTLIITEKIDLLDIF